MSVIADSSEADNKSRKSGQRCRELGDDARGLAVLSVDEDCTTALLVRYTQSIDDITPRCAPRRSALPVIMYGYLV